MTSGPVGDVMSNMHVSNIVQELNFRSVRKELICRKFEETVHLEGDSCTPLSNMKCKMNAGLFCLFLLFPGEGKISV